MDSRLRGNERRVGLAWRATCRVHPDRTRQPTTVGRPEAAHPEPVRASALGVRGINPNSTRAREQTSNTFIPAPSPAGGVRKVGIGGAQNGGHPIELFAVAFRRPTLTFAPMQPPFSRGCKGSDLATPPPGGGRRAVASAPTKAVRENRVFEAMRNASRLLSRRTPLAIGTPSLPVRYTRARPAVRPSTHVAVGPARLPAGQATSERIREDLGAGISGGCFIPLTPSALRATAPGGRSDRPARGRSPVVALRMGTGCVRDRVRTLLNHVKPGAQSAILGWCGQGLQAEAITTRQR